MSYGGNQISVYVRNWECKVYCGKPPQNTTFQIHGKQWTCIDLRDYVYDRLKPISGWLSCCGEVGALVCNFLFSLLHYSRFPTSYPTCHENSREIQLSPSFKMSESKYIEVLPI